MKIRLYYHFPSQDKHLSYSDSIEVLYIEDVGDFLKSISSEDDSVTLYSEDKPVKISFLKGESENNYQLEIITSSGVLYLLEDIERNEIQVVQSYFDKLEKILLSPEKYGFELESI